MTTTQVECTQIKATPDPKHGVPCARSSHGVSLVHNGSRLIVYGGEHVARTPIGKESACWVVDDLQAKPSWRWLDCSKGPPERIAHTQAVYDDKFVYVFGGRAGVTMNEQAMDDLWVLDCSGPPGTESWSEVVPEKGDAPPEARSFHRMICIGCSLYVFGGCGVSSGRLADLHRFDIKTRTWHTLEKSALRGRGGPNLVALSSGAQLGVVAGFCGEETSDGQIFDIASGKWNASLLTTELQDLRPRSVCVSGSFPSLGIVVIFGGEVDPSDRGHEGAGGFENDIVVLDEGTGSFKENIKASKDSATWPEQRGWSDAAVFACNESGQFFIFGGLSGDDTSPRRLDDLWRLDIQASSK
jgi:hypothetical protein